MQSCPEPDQVLEPQSLGDVSDPVFQPTAEPSGSGQGLSTADTQDIIDQFMREQAASGMSMPMPSTGVPLTIALQEPAMQPVAIMGRFLGRF